MAKELTVLPENGIYCICFRPSRVLHDRFAPCNRQRMHIGISRTSFLFISQLAGKYGSTSIFLSASIIRPLDDGEPR